MKLIRNTPRFSCKTKGFQGTFARLKIVIKNVSDNAAFDISIPDIRIINEDGKIFWKSENVYKIEALAGDGEKEILLMNPSLAQENLTLRFSITCKCSYGSEHIYDAFGTRESSTGPLIFKVVEKTVSNAANSLLS